MMDNTPDNKNYLQLFLEEQRILLAVSSVSMVLTLATLQEIPSTDKAFKGILNFHGKGIPVYDLLMLIDPEKQMGMTIDTPIIVGLVDDHKIGLLVSSVKDLISIDTAILQTPSTDAMPYVKFIYETQTENAWGLDLNVLIRYRQLHLEHEQCDE